MAPAQRAGALTIAGIVIAFALSLALPDRTGRAELAEASGPQLARLAPLAADAATSGPLALRGAFGDRIEGLADAALRVWKARPRFPVRGPFNWGQEGASFGAARGGRSHEGQDVMSVTGTPMVSATGGVVLETGDDGGRGNYVAIYDPERRLTFVYLHMNHPALVKPRERVRGGQRIGAVGCTGSCFGPHLHFEVRRGRALDGPAIDPLPLLSRWARADGVPDTLPPGTG